MNNAYLVQKRVSEDETIRAKNEKEKAERLSEEKEKKIK